MDKLKGMGLGAGAVVGGNTLAGLLTLPTVALDPVLTSSDARKLLSQANKGLKRKISPVSLPSVGFPQGAYSPGTHQIFSFGDQKAGLLAHEFGHAKNFQGPYREMSRFNKLRAHLHNPKLMYASGILPLIGAASDDEQIQDAAPLSALLMVPMLLEEGAASLRGLYDVTKSLGLKRGLKAAPGLAAAWATYASIPALSAYMAKRMVDKRREIEADR